MKVLQRSTSGFQALNSPPPSDDATGQTSETIKSPTSSSSKYKRVKRTLDSIDREKLDQLVKSHTEKLWSAVAAEYGEEYSPEMLEKAWKKKIVKKTTPTTTTASITTLTATATTMAPPPPSSTWITTQTIGLAITNNGPTIDEFVKDEEANSPQSDKLSLHPSPKDTSETNTAIETTPLSPTLQQTELNVTNIVASTPTSPPRPVLSSMSTLKESSPRQPVDSPTEPTANALSEKCRISMPSGMCEVPMINAK